METAKICQNCGKPLDEKAVQGLCPECLIKVGLGTGTVAAGSAPADPGSFIPPKREELAAHFPQLEILEFIGRGGMGAVYRAQQKSLDRPVALKILPTGTGRDRAFAERFVREARALARLSHPNIVAVYDFGQAGEFCYFIMEFVDGVNLRQMLHAHRLSPRESMSVVPQICEALQYAHDQGIVHRDIKPENILVDKQGRVKIADFGLAKLLGRDPHAERLTRTAEIMGTPQYMAPEQLEKPLDVDHRADIYSLGVVFYEMLTGELPIGRFAPPSKKVQVDVRLDEIVLRTLEKEPALRYQQASQVRTDLQTVVTPATQSSPIQPNKNPMNTRTSKSLWIGLVAGVGACLVIGLVVWILVSRSGGNATLLAQEGWQLWQAQRLPEAIAKFEQSLKLAPNDANTWNGLGWASLNSGQVKQAEQAFTKCTELAPDHPAALNGLGQIYLARRQYADAEKYLLKAAPQAPAAWYGLARIYLIEGKFPQAEEYAKKIVDSGQGDETARKMLEAAREKKLSDGLRAIIEPQAAR